MPQNQKHGSVLLHLCLLSALAFAQPLYNLIGQNPEFLVAHNITGMTVAGFAIVLSAVIPVLLYFLYWLAAKISLKTGTIALVLMLWVLATIIFLPISVKWFKLDGIWAMTAATGSGLLIASLYQSTTVMRLFLNAFSFAALVFPLLFLFHSPANEILQDSGQKQGSAALNINADNPVFLFVFDEFPTLSILDSDMNIDGGRFPVLANLQQDAMWYRNHSANSNSTMIAIPALLSGNMPYGSQRGLPTAENFPDNLFALLGHSYSINAAEHATRLCPVTVCGEQPNEFRLLFSDTWILLANILAPPAWARYLPPVNNDWKNFANLINRAPDPLTIRGFQKQLKWATRVRDYQDFVENITADRAQLYYFHAMLPHATWKHLPDGSLIVADEPGGILAARPNSPELPFKHMWYDDAAAMRVNRQRHILQTGFVDTLIGTLLDRLKSLGIYDESLIILSSDHGVSFQPGGARRNVFRENLVEISAVPLLIKYPGNAPAGISDINSQAMDIVPTVLDVLGGTGWDGYQGRSLRNPADRPLEKTLHEANKSAIYIDSDEHLRLLEQKARALAAEYGEHDFASLYKAGDRWGLTGKPVSSLSMAEFPAPTVEIDQADLYQRINLSAGFLPLVVHGKLMANGTPLPSTDIAISVNGTIQAVSSLLQLPGMTNEFELLLPPAGFIEGANRVEAWLVLASDDGISLQRTQTAGIPQFRLTASEVGPTVVSIDGVEMPVEDRVIVGGSQAMQGESENLFLLSGWAADIENGKAAESIIIFIDGEFYSALTPGRATKSVAERYSEPGLANCGFRLPVAVSSAQHAKSMEVRVFAVSAGQRISELSYSVKPGRWPFKINPRP